MTVNVCKKCKLSNAGPLNYMKMEYLLGLTGFLKLPHEVCNNGETVVYWMTHFNIVH